MKFIFFTFLFVSCNFDIPTSHYQDAKTYGLLCTGTYLEDFDNNLNQTFSTSCGVSGCHDSSNDLDLSTSSSNNCKNAVAYVQKDGGASNSDLIQYPLTGKNSHPGGSNLISDTFAAEIATWIETLPF